MTFEEERVPLGSSGSVFEVNDRKSLLPVRIGDVTRSPLAHAEILNPQKDPPVDRGTCVRAEAMGVTLQDTHSFGLNQEPRC